MAVSLLVPSRIVCSQKPEPNPEKALTIGGVTVAALLTELGAKMETGVTLDQLATYARHFAFMDGDGDGRHSKEEFVDQGRYMTPQARQGIFVASERDGDGFVSRAEYILNRVITDEAKAILQAMDDNADGVIGRNEFLKHAFAQREDRVLAEAVFDALDSSQDGQLIVPEYLRVWGNWARHGRPSAEKRMDLLEQAPKPRKRATTSEGRP